MSSQKVSVQNPIFEREDSSVVEDEVDASLQEDDNSKQLSSSKTQGKSRGKLNVKETFYESTLRPPPMPGAFPIGAAKIFGTPGEGKLEVHQRKLITPKKPPATESPPPAPPSAPTPPATSPTPSSSSESSFSSTQNRSPPATQKISSDLFSAQNPIILEREDSSSFDDVVDTIVHEGGDQSLPLSTTAALPPPTAPVEAVSASALVQEVLVCKPPETTKAVVDVSYRPTPDVTAAQSFNVFAAQQKVEVFSTPIVDLTLVEKPTPPIEISETIRQTYETLVDDLYDKVINAAEDDNCCDKCCEACCSGLCQSVDCSELYSCVRNRTAEGKKLTEELVTPALRKGRQFGIKILTEVVFPLLRGICRDVWIIIEWLLVAAGLSLSIASFSLGNRAAFNILHLVLSILSFVLATMDSLLSLWDCKTRDACKSCVASIGHPNADFKSNGQLEAGLNAPSKSPKVYWLKSKEVVDFIRIIATELLFYPLLVCDLFEFIVGKAWDAESAGDRVNFALFIIGILGLIFYVYVLRLFVLGSAIHHLRMIRKPKGIDKRNTDGMQNQYRGNFSPYDPSIGKASLYFQSYFFVHVFLQMLAQICMLIAISIKIKIDNENVNSEDDPITVTNALWFLLAAGYVMPVFGILTFFIVTYYWVQFEFPNSIVIDLLSILETPGVDHVIFPKASTKETNEKVGTIAKYLNRTQLVADLRNITFSKKFSYPFSAPITVVLCLVYTTIQVAFVVIAIVFINSSTYLPFYVISIFFAVIANLYVFAVAALWTIIFSAIVLAVAAVIIVILCFCCLAMLAGGQSQPAERRY